MRYSQLLTIVKREKPKSIVEIGTWNGKRAIEFMMACPGLHYMGYDLFEDANDTTDKEEANVKAHYSLEQVRANIAPIAKGTGCTFELFKGNTRETLKSTVADFAFIDGGHSLETIRSDYENLKDCKTIVLDDFYVNFLDVEKYGCNMLVKDLRAKGLQCNVLHPGDKIRNGTIYMVSVRK